MNSNLEKAPDKILFKILKDLSIIRIKNLMYFGLECGVMIDYSTLWLNLAHEPEGYQLYSQ